MVAPTSGTAREAAEAGAPTAGSCVLESSPVLGKPAQHYTIRPGDELLVSFYMSPEFDRDITVQPDGKINLQVAGTMSVAGLTLAQVEEGINQAYKRELNDPQATVVLKNSPSWVVYVVGEVGHPGAAPLVPQMTAMGRFQRPADSLIAPAPTAWSSSGVTPVETPMVRSSTLPRLLARRTWSKTPA